MFEGLPREELNLLIDSLDAAMAALEARLKRARVEHREIAAVRHELDDVRRRRDKLLDDLAALPPGGQA